MSILFIERETKKKMRAIGFFLSVGYRRSACTRVGEELFVETKNIRSYNIKKCFIKRTVKVLLTKHFPFLRNFLNDIYL